MFGSVAGGVLHGTTVPVVVIRHRIAGSVAYGVAYGRGWLGQLSRAMLVSAVMTSFVVTVEPEQRLYAAASLLREGRFRHLPVVRDGQVVGIISDREELVTVTLQ